MTSSAHSVRTAVRQYSLNLRFFIDICDRQACRAGIHIHSAAHALTYLSSIHDIPFPIIMSKKTGRSVRLHRACAERKEHPLRHPFMMHGNVMNRVSRDDAYFSSRLFRYSMKLILFSSAVVVGRPRSSLAPMEDFTSIKVSAPRVFAALSSASSTSKSDTQTAYG